MAGVGIAMRAVSDVSGPKATGPAKVLPFANPLFLEMTLSSLAVSGPV